MNMMEIIKGRRSVRTFDGTALKKEDAESILNFAEKIENPYDIPIYWKVLNAEKYGLSSPVISGADTYIAGKMMHIPHAEEAFGYAFEKICLYAKSLGIGTTMIGGTMNRGAFEQALGASKDDFMPCISPLGYPAKKMSFKETMMRKGLRADSRTAFKELFFDGSFDAPLTEETAGSLREPLEAVRLAPSAVNKQPWRLVALGDKVHFYEKRSKGFVSEDGSDMQKIDMGVALAHFEIAAAESGLTCSFEIADPGLSTQEDMIYIASYTVKQ
ncbi:MAG: nitroreductase [Lachnospiraceae bacterium]|nr:nitroreductase [Lachnospiraceae bacterium]MBR1649601.1 nitroreductase [Lachnospiraceae bacterium]